MKTQPQPSRGIGKSDLSIGDVVSDKHNTNRKVIVTALETPEFVTELPPRERERAPNVGPGMFGYCRLDGLGDDTIEDIEGHIHGVAAARNIETIHYNLRDVRE